MKKKLLSALLAFALSLGTATIPAAAAEVDSAGGQVSAQLNTVSLNGRTSSNVDRHIYNVWSKPVSIPIWFTSCTRTWFTLL